jgi:indole-3-glycerol phosphate synthase
MSILQEIIEHKKVEVEKQKKINPLQDIKATLEALNHPPRKLFKKPGKLQLIAEIKRKSPSRGIIRQEFDPVHLAKEFTGKGASAISVLTDEKFFGGSLDILKLVETSTDLPILRKDFIADIYQIYQTRLIKADIILLLVNVLGLKLEKYLSLALRLGLQPLIETHTAKELSLVLSILEKIEKNQGIQESQIILGINNRNLNTFQTTLQNSLELVKIIPNKYFKLSESGIFSVGDLDKLYQAGFDGVLIGEGLARDPQLLEYFR